MNYFLSNEDIELQFNSKNGAIIGLLNKKTNWQIIRQPKLGSSIRLLVPIEKYRNNKVLCDFQQLDEFNILNKNKANLKWSKVYGDKSSELDISVTLTITLKKSKIFFEISIKNNSPYIVEEIWCPILGGVREMEGEPSLKSMSLNCQGDLEEDVLGDGFPSKCNYWSVDTPTFIKTFPAPEAHVPFIIITNNIQGIYIGNHDEEINIVNFVHELKPGYIDSKHARIPEKDEISGKPAGFVISVVRIPFIQPGENELLAPIVVSLFEDTWHGGVNIYKSWRKSWYKPRTRPRWLNEIDCWLTLHMNSPEGCTRYRYNELFDIAKEAKDKGVGALQILGWASDGQDGAEPYQNTDCRLGTRKELKEAIKKIENIGVRVFLMCKFKWADQSIPEFKKEILNYTLKDMYGNYVQFDGYAYQTMTQQLKGGSRRCGAGICHLTSEFRKIALREFKKIFDLGSSAILYDELINDMLLCFDLDHNHKFGECNTKGTLELSKEFYEFFNKIKPNFLMAGEGPNDYLSQYYFVNYIRTWDWISQSTYRKNYIPAWKYMNPEMKMATCIIGFDDREMINQCIAYGYIINYEPYNFKGKISDFPHTVSYGQKAQKIRKKLWDYIWNGDFRDTIGVNITLENNKLEYICSVFYNKVKSKSAIIVVNQDKEKELIGKVTFNDRSSKFNLYNIENDIIENCDGNVLVKPRSLIVLEEK